MPHRLTVGDIMTREVVTLAEDDTLADARTCMERGRIRQIPVRKLMHDAYAVPATVRVRDAAKVMLDKQYGCLPVVDGEGNLLGIVTEADFLRLAVRMLDAIQA